MKLAVVAGGWHWPLHFFEAIAKQNRRADLFVIGHRNPELPIVREEKRELLEKVAGPLGDLDRELYAAFPTIDALRRIGWHYEDAPNTVGDWGFFNQWLERHDYREYDIILNCHDDTYIRRPDLFDQLAGDWLILSNGTYPQAPDAYVRGSFEFWKREMLDRLGGRFDLGDVTLTREGKTDSPAGMSGITAWNGTCVPLRRMMANQGMAGRIGYLSPYYRISRWAIEGERGWIHSQDGVPWSFSEGLRQFPVEALC